MRALPIGWSSPTSRLEDRISRGVDFARATHGDPSAILAALAVAGMGAWSAEGAPIERIVEHGLTEARSAVELVGGSPTALSSVELAVNGQWHSPAEGVPFTGIDTVAAVIAVLHSLPSSTADCIIRAVSLGGDTDTVAAIAAGIFATTTVDDDISWKDLVPLLAEVDLQALAEALAQRRAAENPTHLK